MNISPVVQKASMKSFDEKLNDLNYWLTQPVVKRLEAVTFLISQSVDLSVTRIDKTHVVRRKLKPWPSSKVVNQENKVWSLKKSAVDRGLLAVDLFFTPYW